MSQEEQKREACSHLADCFTALILYSEDNPGGGGPGERTDTPGSPQPTPTPPPGNPEKPPAAETVVNSTKTERELALEQQLEAERNERKNAGPCSC